MPLPLQQSPTDSGFRFRNTSEFPSLSGRCINATASSWRVNFFTCCNTRYKQSVVGDVIISFAQYYFY